MPAPSPLPPWAVALGLGGVVLVAAGTAVRQIVAYALGPARARAWWE
jgi:hypothetical protein